MASAPHQRSVFQSPPGTDTGVWSGRFPGPQADVSISKEIASLNVIWYFPATGKQILIWGEVYKPLPNRDRAVGGPPHGWQCSRGAVRGTRAVFLRGWEEKGELCTHCCAFGHFVQVPWNQGQLASSLAAGGSNVSLWEIPQPGVSLLHRKMATVDTGALTLLHR